MVNRVSVELSQDQSRSMAVYRHLIEKGRAGFQNYCSAYKFRGTSSFGVLTSVF